MPEEQKTAPPPESLAGDVAVDPGDPALRANTSAQRTVAEDVHRPLEPPAAWQLPENGEQLRSCWRSDGDDTSDIRVLHTHTSSSSNEVVHGLAATRSTKMWSIEGLIHLSKSSHHTDMRNTRSGNPQIVQSYDASCQRFMLRAYGLPRLPLTAHLWHGFHWS
ncbi:hypothetical protein Bbelb_208410 [Branchiostoma belcheri]|nr:hypothetical protein Bbelb_208410 [Branchiostoma belcheri]